MHYFTSWAGKWPPMKEVPRCTCLELSIFVNTLSLNSLPPKELLTFGRLLLRLEMLCLEV